jgi:hypothetical protein
LYPRNRDHNKARCTYSCSLSPLFEALNCLLTIRCAWIYRTFRWRAKAIWSRSCARRRRGR